MKTFDDVASVLFAVIMSHGQLDSAVAKLEKAMDTLEGWLA
jgi:predicted DNA-binding ArsR family transcriptional regulator